MADHSRRHSQGNDAYRDVESAGLEDSQPLLNENPESASSSTSRFESMEHLPPHGHTHPLPKDPNPKQRSCSFLTPGKTIFMLTLCLIVLALYFTLGATELPPRGTVPVGTEEESYVDKQSEVGRVPFMGWNTWNAYWCQINESLVLENARLMVSLGLKDAGYNYVNIDDCYSEKERNEQGDIVANKQTFPSGMRKITDEIHSLGMKAGIYGDSGWFTCQSYPGSFRNEERDAKLFRETWGFDLLKYDNCGVPFDSIIKEGQVGKFTPMAKALSDLSHKTGKPPMLYSICQWGEREPWIWAKRLGHSWRTTRDIEANWGSITNLIDQNSFHSWASDFYGHNDMDMLEIGNGDLNYEESKSHFTTWALMKSPLVIGTHLPRATKETLEILTNREIIAINQDPVVGTAITPFRWGINPDYTSNRTHPAQYWSGRSQNGTVFMLLNTLDKPADMFFNLIESPWIRAGRAYSVRDLWTHTSNGTAIRNFTARAVPPHGVVALLLTDAGDEPEGLWPPCVHREWCSAENGTRYDDA